MEWTSLLSLFLVGGRAGEHDHTTIRKLEEKTTNIPMGHSRQKARHGRRAMARLPVKRKSFTSR